MITYYTIPNEKCSYRIISDHHIQELIRRGFKVKRADIQKDTIPDDFAVIHPLFFAKIHNRLPDLSRNHKYIVGFEVSDTDKLSPEWVEFLNDSRIDLIITASNFSCYAMRRSGVLNKIRVIPHGVSKKFKPKGNNINNPPKVLTIIEHTWFRKGADILIEVAKRFSHITFTVKGAGLRPYNKEKIPENVVIVDEWMGEDELVDLYNSHDIYLATHRGGGFELMWFACNICWVWLCP